MAPSVTINNPRIASFPSGAYSLLTPATYRYAYIQPSPPRSYVMQWNFNVQRQLAGNTVPIVDYAGSRGVHLPYFINDFNGVLPTPTPAGYLWPSKVGTKLNPALGQISGTLWNSDSEYEAFQTQLNRRLAKGLQGTVSYTFSKAIDSGSSSLASDTFTNSEQRLWYDPSEGRGLSDFDIRHLLSVNFILGDTGCQRRSGRGPLAGQWLAAWRLV